MSSHELEIRMSLKDEISKRLQGIQGAMSKFASIANEIGDLGQKFERLGRNLTFLGAAITGPFALAMRNAAQYSLPVKTELENLNAIFTTFQVQIAQAVVPIVQKFTNILANLYSAFTKLSPGTRDAFLQTTMLIGVYGTLAGIVFSLAGHIGKLVKQLSGLGVVVAAISPIQKVILAVIGSLIILIALWDQLKIVAIPVLNLIETAVYGLSVAVTDVYMIIDKAFELASRAIQNFCSLLSKIPGQTKKMFESISQSAKSVADEFEKGFNYQLSLGSAGMQHIFDTWRSGQGDLAMGMDALTGKIKEIWQTINNPSTVNMDELKAWLARSKEEAQDKFNAIKEIVSGTVRAMEQSFGDFFYNTITGQLNSAQEMFINFGQSILRILSDVFAKILIIKSITMLAGPGGKLFGIPIENLFHEGGMIKKMHAGGSIRRAHEGLALAPDEVPIIAQTGEGVLSRKGMAAIGGERNLNLLNKGISAEGNDRGVHITPILVVKAWYTTDVMKHKREIEACIIDSIRNNRNLRSTFKKYI